MSVKSHASQSASELALLEAPSLGEHQRALSEQLGSLRKRLEDFLASEAAREKPEQLHRE